MPNVFKILVVSTLFFLWCPQSFASDLEKETDENSSISLSKNEKFFHEFFSGLEKLDIRTEKLYELARKISSIDLSGFDGEDEKLGGYGEALFGAYKLLQLNPNMDTGKDHFNDEGDLNSFELLNPRLAEVVIHEFWHAYVAQKIDDDDVKTRQVKALYEQIQNEIREDGLDEAVREEGYVDTLSHIGNFRFSDDGLYKKFASDYSNEAVGFFLGTALNGLLAIERILIHYNFKQGLTANEVAFILGKEVDDLSSEDANDPKLSRFVLPPYLNMALSFSREAKGVFLPFGGNSTIDKKSRDYDFEFSSHFEAYNEPYFYSGFKNWSSVRPKSGAIAIRKEHGKTILKDFIGLNMPATMQEVLTRMNGGTGYADRRAKLKRMRSTFLRMHLGANEQLNSEETEFLDMSDIATQGGQE